MTRKERYAAVVVYILGGVWCAAAAAVAWLHVTAYTDGILLPLDRPRYAWAAYAAAAAITGALHLYAAAQIAYSVPGWQKESVALICGSAGAAAAIAHQVSLLVGLAMLLGAASAAYALLAHDDITAPASRSRAALLAGPGLALCAATLIVARAAGSFGADLQTLMPPQDTEVAGALARLNLGRYDHAHVSPATPLETMLDVEGLLAAPPSGTTRSVGSSDLTACDGWGVQSHDRVQSASIRLLAAATPSAVAFDFWVEEDGVRARAPYGTLEFRRAHSAGMLPYIPHLRDVAAAGASGGDVGLCSIMRALPFVSTLSDASEGRIELTLEGPAIERAARISEANRQHIERMRDGWPEAVSALLTLTRASIPDMQNLSMQPRRVTLTHEGGTLSRVSVSGAEGETLATVALRPAELAPPPLPDPRDVRGGTSLPLRLLGPGGALLD